jgi:hypothetical protein
VFFPFTIPQMGVVSTSCSHDPNNDCAANDLSFEGCGFSADFSEIFDG